MIRMLVTVAAMALAATPATAAIDCPATDAEVAELELREELAPTLTEDDARRLETCELASARRLGEAIHRRLAATDAKVDAPAAPRTRGFRLARPKSAAPGAAPAPARPSASASAARPRTAAVRARPALPAFPWPAPKPVRQVVVPVASVGGPNATLDQVLAKLERGIARASSGYETGVFGGPPGGFVVLTRMERIQKDGAPFPGANRFTLKGNPRAGFWDMLDSLLVEKPGYFRVIAFVVADDLAIDPNKPVSTIPDVGVGASRLPPALGRQKLGDRRVYALVYAYQRPAEGAHKPWTEGAPSALQHLRQSGIARAIGF